jgi:hypothetical protein
MASNPDMSLEWLIFGRDRSPECGPKTSLRRNPQPQAKGYDGDGADPAEPKRYKPQQALRQRRRLWLLRHQ